jgi:hypothetical protein
MEAQAHPLIMAILRFIQLGMPSPPLKPMGQSRRGVLQVLEAQASVSPELEAPHALIDPSALRAAKANSVE